MKRSNWLLIGLVVLCLAMVSLVGCAKCEFRDFSSITELEEWLRENDVSERPATEDAGQRYRKALDIQEDALGDGYIVSADYDYDLTMDTYYIHCVTIIDGDIWYWDPETDDPYANYFLGKVK